MGVVKKEMKIIGQLCKEYRKEHLNESLPKFAKMVGIPYNTLWSFENGESRNMETFMKYFILMNPYIQEVFMNELASQFDELLDELENNINTLTTELNTL